jgi:thioredoxin-like negative regulator of GroEL
MRLSVLASSTLLLAASYVAAADESDVIDLTPDNFSSVVEKEPLMLVEFFAPWYGSVALVKTARSDAFFVQVRSLQSFGTSL